MSWSGELTAAQLAAVDRRDDACAATALSTERCDRPAAEAAVRAAYTAAGLTPPAEMIWMDSPLGGVIATAALCPAGKPVTHLAPLLSRLQVHLKELLRQQLRGPLAGQLRQQVEGQLGQPVDDRTRALLDDQLGEHLRRRLHSQVERRPRTGLWRAVFGQLVKQLACTWDEHEPGPADPLEDQLDAQLAGPVGDRIRAGLPQRLRERPRPLRHQLSPWILQEVEPWNYSHRLAGQASALEVLGLPTFPLLDAVVAAVRHTGWWWPLHDAVVLTDRPTDLHLEARHPHHDSGPALRWADGYTLYAWHGLPVPADLITGGWTTERAQLEPNPEFRQCATDRYGWTTEQLDGAAADRSGTLTAQQGADADRRHEDWTSVALSTERCDRPAAEAAVRAAYTTAGLAPPDQVVWMDSPFGGLLARAVVRRLRDHRPDESADPSDGQFAPTVDELLRDIRDRLSDLLRGRLTGVRRGRLRAALLDRLDKQRWFLLADRVERVLAQQMLGERDRPDRIRLREQLRGPLLDQLAGPHRNELADLPDHELPDDLLYVGTPDDGVGIERRQFVGPWSTLPHLLALYTAAMDAAGLPPSPRLEALAKAVRHTGWWWPMHDAVILTDRPTALHLDGSGLLHHDSGPALAYADGFALHSWHGVVVPADLVAGDGWDPRRIIDEPNAEIRRCAIERCGWDRFAVEAGLCQVGPAEPDPGNPGGELRLYDVPRAIQNPRVRVLVCDNASPDRDGSRRRFGLTVPADVPDATTAAAWTYGIGRDEYTGLRRST